MFNLFCLSQNSSIHVSVFLRNCLVIAISVLQFTIFLRQIYLFYFRKKNTMFIQFKSFCYKLNFFTRVCLGVPFYFSWICKKSVVRILCDMRTAFTLTSQSAFLLIFLNIYLINICFNNIILSLILLILNSIFLIPYVK